MNFPSKLKDALKRVGWSARNLEFALPEFGSSPREITINRWLKGESEPNLSNAQALVRCFREHGIDDFSIDPPYGEAQPSEATTTALHRVAAGNSTEAAV